jgi:hypothetical protein
VTVEFSSEEEARAFARTQPPGVIGVVPTTVTEPGSPKWQQREMAVADARARLKAEARAKVDRRLGTVARVLRFVVLAVVFCAVVYTAWAIEGLHHDGITIRAPHCLGEIGTPS